MKGGGKELVLRTLFFSLRSVSSTSLMEIKIALGLTERRLAGREQRMQQQQQLVLSLTPGREGREGGAGNVQDESDRITRTQKNIHFLESDARLSEEQKEEEEGRRGR